MKNCYQSIFKNFKNTQCKNSKTRPSEDLHRFHGGCYARLKPEIDERLRQYILGKDPNLVMNVRVLNKGQPDNKSSREKVWGNRCSRWPEAWNCPPKSFHFMILLIKSQKMCLLGTAIPSDSSVISIYTKQRICKNCGIV